MTIESLIEKLKQGDENAAVTFLTEYGEHIRREARRRMADERLLRFFDQSDIFQSVMISFVLRVRAGSLPMQEANELLAFLVTMTRNKVSDRYRQLTAQKRDYRLDGAQMPSEANRQLPGQMSTPSQIVSIEEQLKSLEEKIPADIRSISELRKSGKSWDEIASHFGETSDTLRKRFSRAFERIESELMEEE